MKRTTLGIGIAVAILLCVGIFLFFYPSEHVQYKTFQKEGLSFKYPANWKDYTADIPEEDILVAVGDPETVGFQNMSIPTTMIVIKKSVIPIIIFRKDYQKKTEIFEDILLDFWICSIF